MGSERDVLTEAAAALRLDEGVGALRDFLARAHLRGGISVRDMARYLDLPVPVTSAVKNELKKRGFLGEGGGTRLSEKGRAFVLSELGFAGVDAEKYLSVVEPDSPGAWCAADFSPVSLTGFERELAVLEEIYAKRPTVDTSLDQSMCAAETGLRRALLMLRDGVVVGKNIACAGDDDLVSIALCLVLKAVSQNGDISGVAGITVFDMDGRFLDYISCIAQERGFPVRRVLYDLREPIPAEFTGVFDAAVTDPPYTRGGLSLFLSRIRAFLKPEPNTRVYLSYAHKSPLALLEAQRLILGCGFLISGIFPKFNRYVGAQILGGVSDMLALRSAETAEPPVPADARFDGAIYTNEVRRSARVYLCLSCGARRRVGHGEETETIEKLKERGCACGGKKFRLEGKESG